MVFYIVDIFFNAVKLHVMTKNVRQVPEWMTTSTICRDEPKTLLNLVHLDVVVYVTHSVKR